jgi:hypothetical protein
VANGQAYPGGLTVSVSVTPTRAVLIGVDDDGLGIPGRREILTSSWSGPERARYRRRPRARAQFMLQGGRRVGQPGGGAAFRVLLPAGAAAEQRHAFTCSAGGGTSCKTAKAQADCFTLEVTCSSKRKGCVHARSRRQPADSRSPEFRCPGAGGRSRAAALGPVTRRRRAWHDTSAAARSGATTRRPKRTSAAGAAASDNSTTTRARRRDSAAEIDRDRLLQTIFPSGVPAREEVIRAANAWLDEAERLAHLS